MKIYVSEAYQFKELLSQLNSTDDINNINLHSGSSETIKCFIVKRRNWTRQIDREHYLETEIKDQPPHTFFSEKTFNPSDNMYPNAAVAARHPVSWPSQWLKTAGRENSCNWPHWIRNYYDAHHTLRPIATLRRKLFSHSEITPDLAAVKLVCWSFSLKPEVTENIHILLP